MGFIYAEFQNPDPLWVRSCPISTFARKNHIDEVVLRFIPHLQKNSLNFSDLNLKKP